MYFEINEVLRQEDIKAVLKWSTKLKNQPEGRRNRAIGGILTLVCGWFLLKWIATLFHEGYESWLKSYAVTIPLFLVLFLILGILHFTNGRILMPWIVRYSWKNYREKNQIVKLLFDETGFQSKTLAGGSDYRYSAVSEWTEDEERYLMAVAGVEVFVVRKDCFTCGEAAAFGSWLAERLEESSTGEAAYREEAEAAFQVRMVYTPADFMALSYADSHPRPQIKNGKKFLKKKAGGRLILCMIFAAMLTLQLFASGVSHTFAIVVGAMAAIAAWFFSGRQSNGTGGEAMWRQYRDKGSEVAYWFSEEYFTWRNRVGLHHLFYDQLEGIGEDGNHFFLFVTNQKAVHILRKDGFLQGAVSDFVPWIEARTRERKNGINQQG